MRQKPEKSRLVCVFAHPDDEAFGPSGTIAKFASRGEVYLICVTDGDDHTNGKKDYLAKIREEEVRKSAKILGVKRVYCLGYKDGELCNNLYHEVAREVRKILDKIKPDTLMTFEMRGVSGHVDHVFCSMVSSYIFRETKYIKKILYYCLPKIMAKLEKNYFIYFPPGYSKNEVDLVENVTEFWDIKIQAIKAHESQKKDGNQILKLLKIYGLLRLPKEEYFLVMKR